MKIEKRENIKGEIKTTVVFENERFTRLQKDIYGGLVMRSIVQWKKTKTNHLVNSNKYKLLEDTFQTFKKTTITTPTYAEKGHGNFKMVASGSTCFDSFFKTEDKKIEEEVLSVLLKDGMLSAIKFYKDKSGLGLKESKDYVDKVVNLNYAYRQNKITDGQNYEIKFSG